MFELNSPTVDLKLKLAKENTKLFDNQCRWTRVYHARRMREDIKHKNYEGCATILILIGM